MFFALFYMSPRRNEERGQARAYTRKNRMTTIRATRDGGDQTFFEVVFSNEKHIEN
jgi:hypothetical protein